jgi:hypothetical protein
MEIPTHAELVEQINSFLDRHQMAPSRFGRDALREPQFVLEVRAGRLPTLGTLRKLKAFMAARDEALESEEANVGSTAPASTSRKAALHRLSAEAR